MMAAKRSKEYRSIGFPKFWFSTPLKERTQIVDHLIDRELEHAERVLNVNLAEKPPEGSAMRATLPEGRSSFRRMAYPRRLSPVDDDTMPQTIQLWQEKNKLMSQRIEEELSKTDVVLEQSYRFKEDLALWMHRMDRISRGRFRQHETSAGSRDRTPKRFAPQAPGREDQSVDRARPKLDKAAMDELERKLRIGKEKYEGKLPERRIIYSLQGHLRKYLGIDSSTSLSQSESSGSSRKFTKTTLSTPRRRHLSARSTKSTKSAKSSKSTKSTKSIKSTKSTKSTKSSKSTKSNSRKPQYAKSGPVVCRKKISMSMSRSSEYRPPLSRKSTLLARRRQIADPPPPPPPSMHTIPSLAQRLGLEEPSDYSPPPSPVFVNTIPWLHSSSTGSRDSNSPGNFPHPPSEYDL